MGREKSRGEKEGEKKKTKKYREKGGIKDRKCYLKVLRRIKRGRERQVKRSEALEKNYSHENHQMFEKEAF